MRALPLTTVRGGINRLRTKGGARNDQLYDLLNGYVTEAGSIAVRPGTERMATLDPLTRGLCAFGGSLHTFCHKAVAVPDGYTLNILVHPDPPTDYSYPYYGYDDEPPAIHKIWFSEPFLGALYVVAEFETGDVYHYWLQSGQPWQPDTIYAAGALVIPTEPNGLVYQASRFGDPYPPWQPDEARYDGVGYDYGDQSAIEPTTYTGFYYRVIATEGPNPRSGTTEPTWPVFEGGTVTERTDAALAVTDSTLPPPAGTSPTTGTAPANPYNPLDDPLSRYVYQRGLIVESNEQYNEP